ncbi:MAG: helix-turn-helix domain-containing protein [Clostridia bacterium]|nr:helix-turn-helix domain-containing protein [Clostridia bacterium]
MSENKKSTIDLIVMARKGNNEAMAELLEQYMPLINKHSYINEKLDEDLRQEIFLKIISNISSFKF